MNIVDAYAVAGNPFQFTTYTEDDVTTVTEGNETEGYVTKNVYPGDYVLIKEEGWVVVSVEWKPYEYKDMNGNECHCKLDLSGCAKDGLRDWVRWVVLAKLFFIFATPAPEFKPCRDRN